MSGILKNKKIKWYVLPLIALIILNVCFITKAYLSYREETVRLGSILSEKHYDELSFEEAESILEKYGYIEDDKSSIYREFIKSSMFMISLSFAIYITIVVTLKKQKKEIESEYNQGICDIERTLNALRDGSFNSSEKKFKKLTSAEFNSNFSRIETLIDSLYSSISIIKENAENDKRETKVVVTDISHQLKTPLAAIKSTYELIQQDSPSVDERKEVENMMGFQIRSLEKLIQSLVNISRLESGMINIKLTKGSLFDSILTAVNGIWLKADEKNIKIEVNDSSEYRIQTIMCDRKWLSEAFVNILDNAVKYSSENTEVSIYITKINQMMRIEFKDQGAGIPDEEKHKVFKRFYRGITGSLAEGSGVGLYLARRIISEHHGTIMVKDNIVNGEKKGSVFVVHLPVVQ